MKQVEPGDVIGVYVVFKADEHIRDEDGNSNRDATVRRLIQHFYPAICVMGGRLEPEIEQKYLETKQ